MDNLIAEIVGWYGTIAILAAYALVSFSVLGANSLIYQLLNFTGGLGIVVISFVKRAYQPATLNVIWSVIGLIALIGIIF